LGVEAERHLVSALCACLFQSEGCACVDALKIRRSAVLGAVKAPGRPAEERNGRCDSPSRGFERGLELVERTIDALAFDGDHDPAPEHARAVGRSPIDAELVPADLLKICLAEGCVRDMNVEQAFAERRDLLAIRYPF